MTVASADRVESRGAPVIIGVLLVFLIVLSMLTPIACAIAGTADPPPPVAETRPHAVKSPHGERIDPYHWLRDDDPQAKRPEILAYLQAENDYTAKMLAPLANTAARSILNGG
mgnify:CR=1 FL=1